MVKLQRSAGFSLGVLTIFALAFTVQALIKVDWTVEKLYKTSKTVAIGKVTEVTTANHVINVDLAPALKGKLPGPKIRVQIVAPAELLKDISAEQPMVFFFADAQGAANAGAVIHVADTWLLANGVPNSNQLVWRVVQAYDTVRQSFPGRTSALVKLVSDLNAGTSTFVDKFERKPFSGGMRKRAQLSFQNATWMIAEDVNGDGKPDLLVGSAAGTRLFISKGDAYEDETEAWGLPTAAVKYHAMGDVNGDGKIDLLLDNALWINQGQKFVAVKPNFELPKGAPLSAALIDVNGDQKLDAAFLSADGELRIFENPGAAEKPWTARAAKQLWNGGDVPIFAVFGDFGDTGKAHAMVVLKNGIMRYAFDADGGAPADAARLSGIEFKKLEKYHEGFKNVTAVTLLINGESRPDLFMYSDAGGLLLLNRGLGTFFMDENASDALTNKNANPLPLAPSPSTAWTRAELHGKGIDDVLLLEADGALYEMDNSPR